MEGNAMATDGRKIVVAMDGSEYANFAFKWYMKHIYRHGDHVVLIYCPEYHAVHARFVEVDITLVAEQIEEEQKKTREFLEHLAEKLKEYGIGGKVKSESGNPGEVIVRVAEEEDADLIVTGSRGLGIVRRTFLGSVSDYVLHHSHVPVIITRHSS
ncbi:universal stress protein Sll1388-like [Gigantopelta aegis]|uniref:universal stress protein Sll1388-like n=1 Tax=Gigantopelta aegis TaxID=1735272 RepID=UPI001B887885|nr:universal stress protein Sll1388-like [Gigantopelta aegis]